MVILGKDVIERIEKLLYFPYTFGKHLEKTSGIIQKFRTTISTLPQTSNFLKRKIPDIGVVTYISDKDTIFVKDIVWCSALIQFYYKKSNFIEFTDKKNIPSVHPSFGNYIQVGTKIIWNYDIGRKFAL